MLQIDESPLDGKVFDRETLEQLSKEGVTLVSQFSFPSSISIVMKSKSLATKWLPKLLIQAYGCDFT